MINAILVYALIILIPIAIVLDLFTFACKNFLEKTTLHMINRYVAKIYGVIWIICLCYSIFKGFYWIFNKMGFC